MSGDVVILPVVRVDRYSDPPTAKPEKRTMTSTEAPADAGPRIYVVQGAGVRFARDLGRARPDQRGRTKRRVQIEGADAPTWVDEAQIFARAVDAKAARKRAVAYRDASAPSLTITEALIELAGQPEPTAHHRAEETTDA